MIIKLGKVRFQVGTAVNSDGARQIHFAISRDESRTVEQCEAWLILSNDKVMPLYFGVAAGRYNDEVKTLRSIDCMIWRGKFKVKRG